jgi:hypothetical protein
LVEPEFEASAVRLSFARELPAERPAGLLVFASERGRLSSTELGQFRVLLVGKPERGLLEGDLRPELQTPPAAGTPPEVLELALGSGQSLLCLSALPVELLALAGEQPRGRVGWRCDLLDRGRLGRGARQGAGGSLGRAGPPRVVYVGLGLNRQLGEIEARLGSRARAGDVAPLAEGAVVGDEDEGALDGGALGGVTGERVGVVELLGGVVER